MTICSFCGDVMNAADVRDLGSVCLLCDNDIRDTIGMETVDSYIIPLLLPNIDDDIPF